MSIPIKIDRSIATYCNAVARNFEFFKRTTQLDDLYAKALRLPDGGYLVPTCDLHIDDDALIADLTSWRNADVAAYPSQFVATPQSTKAWLRDRVLAAPDRMLFLVVNKFGRAVGHMGFASAINDDASLEMDNIVRGVKTGDPGIMRRGMVALIDWAEEKLGPREIYLRVFETNTHAIAFYEKLGFVRDRLLPLTKHQSGDNVNFKASADGETPDTHFVRMSYRPRRKCAGEKMILTAGPSISAREASYALDAARHGWNNEWNKYLRKFEQAFAEYVGVKHALATSSCTGALHLSLLALGIGKGDEVIVPELTWVATANAVLYTGATPIFADVDEDTWCLDADSVAAKITPRTKAIMPVHLYGQPARMDRIMDVAKTHNLFVVEDAAPSIGAEFEGKRTGSFGHFGCFSFQGAKLLVTGEGGMLLTDDTELYQRAYKIWDQGRVPGSFWIDTNGWKYKMSNVQAAIGLGQLERVEELVEAKRRIFGWYAEGLDGVSHLRLNREVPGTRSIYWMTSIYLEDSCPLSRDGLRAELKKRNMDTRDVFPAISQYPVWPVKQSPQPRGTRIGARGINLPSGVCLKRDQVAYMCEQIRELLK
ncbi:MAG: GNAT family N-acetyltransferase [Planctomycetes bacterium]|nr:GNAT family N-acetyltransferase [Planctomycetota bacterium]